MNELNGDKIIKALECCANTSDIMKCQSCPYMQPRSGCNINLMCDALALIKELTEERDALEQHNSYLKGLIDIAFVKELQGFDEKSAVKAAAEAEMWRMIALREKRREEEIERLNAKIYEWRNLVKVLNQNNAELETELAQTYDLLDESKADTVRKMRNQLEKRIDNTIKVFNFQISECDAVRQVLRGVKNDIYQIAKELLEEKNDV